MKILTKGQTGLSTGSWGPQLMTIYDNLMGNYYLYLQCRFYFIFFFGYGFWAKPDGALPALRIRVWGWGGGQAPGRVPGLNMGRQSRIRQTPYLLSYHPCPYLQLFRAKSYMIYSATLIIIDLPSFHFIHQRTTTLAAALIHFSYYIAFIIT